MLLQQLKVGVQHVSSLHAAAAVAAAAAAAAWSTYGAVPS